MRFTLRQLQVFVAVAQHESVSRAAQSLALSQSATSTSLTELERQSDCQLFDRAGKRLALNALGRQLLPEAVALIDQAREIERLLGGQERLWLAERRRHPDRGQLSGHPADWQLHAAPP